MYRHDLMCLISCYNSYLVLLRWAIIQQKLICKGLSYKDNDCKLRKQSKKQVIELNYKITYNVENLCTIMFKIYNQIEEVACFLLRFQ